MVRNDISGSNNPVNASTPPYPRYRPIRVYQATTRLYERVQPAQKPQTAHVVVEKRVPEFHVTERVVQIPAAKAAASQAYSSKLNNVSSSVRPATTMRVCTSAPLSFHPMQSEERYVSPGTTMLLAPAGHPDPRTVTVDGYFATQSAPAAAYVTSSQQTWPATSPPSAAPPPNTLHQKVKPAVRTINRVVEKLIEKPVPVEQEYVVLKEKKVPVPGEPKHQDVPLVVSTRLKEPIIRYNEKEDDAVEIAIRRFVPKIIPVDLPVYAGPSEELLETIAARITHRIIHTTLTPIKEPFSGHAMEIPLPPAVETGFPYVKVKAALWKNESAHPAGPIYTDAAAHTDSSRSLQRLRDPLTARDPERSFNELDAAAKEDGPKEPRPETTAPVECPLFTDSSYTNGLSTPHDASKAHTGAIPADNPVLELVITREHGKKDGEQDTPSSAARFEIADYNSWLLLLNEHLKNDEILGLFCDLVKREGSRDVLINRLPFIKTPDGETPFRTVSPESTLVGCRIEDAQRRWGALTLQEKRL